GRRSAPHAAEQPDGRCCGARPRPEYRSANPPETKIDGRVASRRGRQGGGPVWSRKGRVSLRGRDSARTKRLMGSGVSADCDVGGSCGAGVLGGRFLAGRGGGL